MRWPIAKLVAAQFSFYAIGGFVAFIAWIMVLTGNVSLLSIVVGDYLISHFNRWTTRFYFWGLFVLISAFLALASVYLILRSNKTGGYIGIISFLIGLTVDVLVANVMFVHVLVGLLIGWVLLMPLIFGWDDLFEE